MKARPARDRAEESRDACRADVWLWRARLFKTRALARRFLQEDRVRLTRDAGERRLDKAAHDVRPGDGLVFARDGRLVAVRVLNLGERRGPAAEARALYAELEADGRAELGGDLGADLGADLSADPGAGADALGRIDSAGRDRPCRARAAPPSRRAPP